jgi:short-subunit dehydrogenase
VLVNNAASFYAGYFEELTPEQIERQLATSLIGPMNVTRAVLPVMRKQRSGHIISISSSAGLAAGFDFVSAYAASKFGLEGWMESLQAEVAPFGITPPSSIRDSSARSSSRSNRRTTPSRPSRTTTSAEGRCSSTGKPRTASNPATRRSSRERSSRLPSQEPPPRRFIAGADAIATRSRRSPI